MDGNDLFSLILMVFVLGGIIIFVTQPILKKKPENILQNYYEETPYRELLTKKENIYRDIKSLEFDYKTDKLSDEDYVDERQKLEYDAVQILKQIDEYESKFESAMTSMSSISKPARKKSSVKHLCPECSQPHLPGAKFCGNCGHSLSSVTA